MGYYTDYTLTVSGYNSISQSKRSLDIYDDERIKALEDEIYKMNVFESGGSAKSDFYVNGKWYDHSNDMLLLSHRFPDFLFLLHGEGEISEDMWDEYYLDGAMQNCPAKIVYDKFDPNKLEKMDIKDSIDDKYSYEGGKIGV